MRGNDAVIEQLNAALASELTAIVQYMVQSEMQSNWGYKRLAGTTRNRAIEEMRHAEHLIERILFLDATPRVNVPLTPNLGGSVKEHFDIALKDEHEAVGQYNNSVKICGESGDAGSRELFEHMVKDEEEHVNYLEAQLHTIQEMGIANYLTEQLKD